MTPFHVIFVAWRVLIIVFCLYGVVLSVHGLWEESNTAWLLGIGACGAGAYYAGRDLLT